MHSLKFRQIEIKNTSKFPKKYFVKSFSIFFLRNSVKLNVNMFSITNPFTEKLLRRTILFWIPNMYWNRKLVLWFYTCACVKSKLEELHTHLCPCSKSKYLTFIWSIKSDRVNLVALASPIHRAGYSTN